MMDEGGDSFAAGVADDDDGTRLFTDEQIEQCPSVAISNLTIKETKKRRLIGAGHIVELGTACKVSIFATARACLLYHLFYQHQCLDHFDEQVTAMACLFIACKAESRQLNLDRASYLHISKVISRSYQLVQRERITTDSVLFKEYVDRILFTERVLLASLGFRLDMPTMHDYVKAFSEAAYFPNLVACINTLLPSTLCLTHHPLVIIASIVHSFEKNAKMLPEAWWTKLPPVSGKALTEEDMMSVSGRIEKHLTAERELQREVGADAVFERRDSMLRRPVPRKPPPHKPRSANP
ncbi:hypothetical protein PTSG_00952 [Salpingoeca rosetta]|uniref:Cyclin N-terminal domain-containing protein n=1 Tax=Salpingoeca rosetta (strain ATCC 50818 / BSB-021) TaxID=946362 RepID=F2TXZ1_SALR5|nr:uncharacterized protein PTSG_00952 [Salpingoeca rosetta]EGD76250.1 hypothetical protein PTSG_00952 [Salpingoeca rosetta]|eukprot:XP_004998425.1 hypothetical protein PTSG_00952 [Salpingoeca rosetta]